MRVVAKRIDTFTTALDLSAATNFAFTFPFALRANHDLAAIAATTTTAARRQTRGEQRRDDPNQVLHAAHYPKKGGLLPPRRDLSDNVSITYAFDRRW